MASSAARVLQLLDLLQSAQLRTVTELSGALGVDERTVRRCVQLLRDLDIPVESVRGRYGGYRIARGHRMPPLLLSDDEAVAVVAGLIRAQAASDTPDITVQTALSKLRRVLPAESARRVEALVAVTVVGTASEEAARDVPDGGILLTVADAVANRRPVELRYRNADDLPSRRTVHPYGLLAHAGRWYLNALDVDRREERTFRVDRIRTARRLPGTFGERVPERTVSQLLAGFAEADYPWRIVLHIRSSPKAIRARFPASVATLSPLDAPGWQRAEIHAKSLEWLPPVIAALDGEVVVKEPDELRELLAATADRLLTIARRETGGG